jgi:hypothetical protein
MGDLSFLNVAFWLADAVTVVLVIAGWLTSLVILATSPVIFLTLLGRAAGLMACWSMARFRTLARP